MDLLAKNSMLIMRLQYIASYRISLITMLRESRENSLNSGSVLNIVNRPQSGPSIYSGSKDREAAHQFLMRPEAAK